MGKATQCIHSGSIRDRMNRGLNSLAGRGDHVVMQRDIYGGTHHLATAELERFGIEHSFVGNDPADLEAAIRGNTRLIYIETPSNPLLRVTGAASRTTQAGEGTRRNGRCPAPGGSETHVPSILRCVVPNLHAMRTPFPYPSAKSA